MEKRNYLIGNDDDAGIWGLLIVIVVVMVVVAVIFYGGIFIGGFHAIKNYGVSLKHNLYDSNVSVAKA